MSADELVRNAEAMARRLGDCSFYPPRETSPYVLPYRVGDSHVVLWTTGHFGPGNGGVGLYAIDFAMPIGTRIVAARSGIVVAVRGEFHDGNGEDLKENFVFIQHDDGTVARYFHLTHEGALREVGEAVERGDEIGLSGNTGKSEGPHLPTTTGCPAGRRCPSRSATRSRIPAGSRSGSRIPRSSPSAAV